MNKKPMGNIAEAHGPHHSPERQWELTYLVVCLLILLIWYWLFCLLFDPKYIHIDQLVSEWNEVDRDKLIKKEHNTHIFFFGGGVVVYHTSLLQHHLYKRFRQTLSNNYWFLSFQSLTQDSNLLINIYNLIIHSHIHSQM